MFVKYLLKLVLLVALLAGGAAAQSVTYIKGSGSPESVVTAPIGSLYVRTDGSTGTTLYVKESGTGNTGWVAVASGGGGSQTPWTANVDADGFSLLVDDATGIKSSETSNPSLLLFTSVASAVNYLTLTNSATGNPVLLSATGTDTDISLTLTPKGAGQLLLNQNGTTSVPAMAFTGGTNIGLSNAGSGIQFIYSGTNSWAVNANGSKTFDNGRLDWSSTSATSGTTDITLSRFAANTLRVGGDTAGSTAGKLFVSRSDKTMSGWFTVDGDTANTNAIATLGSLGLDSTGTAAAGLGGRLLLAIETTTTNQTTAGAIDWAWNVATHTSRNGYVSIKATDVGSLVDVARFQGVGSAVNYFDFYPSATGQTIELGAGGSDSNIGINLAPKGTGTVTIATDPVTTENNAQSFTTKSLTDPSNVLGGVTMTLGSDANGDTYYRAGGVLTRLAKGTAGQCYLMNGGATAPEWGSCSGSGGANTALSNLASVAINTTLVSDTDNTDDLGTTSIRWRRLHVATGIYGTTTTAIVGVTSAGSAVNYLDVQNAATGSGPTLSALGSDTNIPFNIQSKGTGVINLTITPSTTNTTDTVLALIRNSSGTPASNIGAAFNYYIGTTTTPGTLAGGQSMRWEDATHATRTSRWWWTTISSAGSLTERMGLDHNGIRLPEISSAATPASGFDYLYFKSGGLYYKNPAGTENHVIVSPLPIKVFFPGGGCNNTTAGAMWDLPTSTPAVPACVTGSNIQKGVLDFADTSGGFSAQVTTQLPTDFTGAMDATITWTTTATSGNAVWQVSTACTDTAASATDDPSFNTASTVTTAAPGTANRVQTSTITGVTATGCAAGNLLHIKVFRDGNHGSDTLSATARMIGLEWTYRRAM